MAQESIEVIYDKDHDILSLFRQGRKSKFSFDIELPKGDIVVDYGFQGEVVGLEFFNASSSFPVLKSKRSQEKLNGRLSVQYGANWATISYEIIVPGAKKIISNCLISPYNKKIALNV
jgi:uncharacterized protein YuzE